MALLTEEHEASVYFGRQIPHSHSMTCTQRFQASGRPHRSGNRLDEIAFQRTYVLG